MNQKRSKIIRKIVDGVNEPTIRMRCNITKKQLVKFQERNKIIIDRLLTKKYINGIFREI